MNKDIKRKLIAFRNERGWGKDHTGPHLARALMIEVGELNELFLWDNDPLETDNLQNLYDELADIAIYLTYLTIEYGIDIENAILDKIEKNAKKYPCTR